MRDVISRPMGLKFEPASIPLEGRTQIWASSPEFLIHHRAGWGLEMCISNIFPGDFTAAGTTLGEPLPSALSTVDTESRVDIIVIYFFL